ncbi:MAG: L-2-amino-thiazoline-4-carboxylic acid hydrolase [Spirochaetes bacterium]|nr:L-2-amino-thiazoline-4-carboxylic acid hydrolase [Spirochaetota bacterium]
MSENSEKKIPLLQEIKIQVDVLMPVIRKMRAELGKKKADSIIADALRPYIRRVYQEIGERKTGSPFEKWEQVWDEIRPRIGDNVERNFIKNDENGKEYNVTRCRFAEFFRELGEPELGVIMMCDFDYYIAETGKPVVELTRTQTLMEGADCCDFCYRYKKE